MPTITQAPRAHSLIQLEAVRQQLAEAAELAADANGVVDTSKVADPTLRDAFEKIADGKLFSTAGFAKRLEKLMEALDRADTGGSARPHNFDHDSLRGVEERAAARRAWQPPSLLGRIAAMLGGPSPDFTVDLKERATIENHPAVGALLAKADRDGKTASETLAKQHFTGPQTIERVFIEIDPSHGEWRRDDNTRPEAYLRGPAGALKDIDAVMVKHHQSGSWVSVQVEKDGSYNLPLGAKAGEVSVWYQKSDGDKFFGGNVAIRASGTEKIASANFAATPERDAEWPPLAYVR